MKLHLLNLISLFICFRPSICIITIENNMYKGITVAIHSSVDDDYMIVENLKTLFTSASAALYKATRERSFFGEITIVVPPHWVSRPEYEAALGGSRFGTADVRIDRSNPHYGNNPYTLQPGGCGEPGQYIHLTSEFIRDLNGSTTEEYGDPAKTFVHEWAHLRYGVFDEYGDEDDYRTPPYYVDENKKIRPTSCGMEIKGWLQTDDFKQCHVGENGLPDENCYFHPDIDDDENNNGSSLMYLHWLPSAEGFCDDENMQHNYAAPNEHNMMCKGKSVWSIVAAHEDFANHNNPPRQVRDITPKFRILQPRKNEKGNYVLVLDVSGSMSGRRISMLHRAASRFVQDQIPDNSQLGIVAFSTHPRVLASMTVVTSETRETLLRSLPRKDDDGNTGIGLGLQEALKLLGKHQTTEGAIIILISDGEENVDPYVADVIDEIRKAKVIIHTIAFGAEASKHLEKLVRLTGGRGFFYSDDEIISSQAGVLQQAFFAAASTQADVDFQPVEVSNQIFYLPGNKEKMGSVIIDKAIGKNSKFLFTYNYTGVMNVTLQSPDGVVYNDDSKEYSHDHFTKSISFKIPLAKPGKWIYTVKNDGNDEGIGFMVTSEVKDITRQPIRIRSWMSDVEFRYPDAASTVKVFAEVKKQYVPVINANVMALIERPDGRTVDLQLHDNGAGADTKKDDGIYSAYFTEFHKNGRYSVAARVINDGQAKLRIKKKKKNSSGAMRTLKPPPKDAQLQPPSAYFSIDDLAPPVPEEEQEYLEEPVDDFERSLLAGSFNLQDWTPVDIIPPNRVTDLQVDNISTETKTITLSWTSPGDDMENGNASVLELRYHTNIKTMWQNFTESFKVTEYDVIEGTLTPLPGGERHNITISFDKTEDDVKGKTFYFGLRCKDKNNNTAEVSNLALAYFVVKYPETQSLPPSQFTLLIVIAVVVTLVIIIITIAACRICSRHSSRKTVFV